MHENTLKRLQRNPHYKLNKEQQEELDQLKREPMIEFGVPEVHTGTMKKYGKLKKKKVYKNTSEVV